MKEQILAKLASACSKKEYCTWDIQQKLAQTELPENEKTEIIRYLQHHKFIDDTRFARLYAEDKLRFNRWGKQKISMMLRQKQIPADIISEALDYIPTENYDTVCLELIQEKIKALHETDLFLLQGKLIRFALGRGFDYDTINRCLKQLL